MTPEEILSHPARVLSQEQREHYFTYGYVGVQDLVPTDIISGLINVTNEFVDLSRNETVSGDIFDIGPIHSTENPVLRRLKMPDDKHDAYWQFASGIMAEVAADLAGPNVVFHHSKLNFKWADGTDKVEWHQDAQFFPHTNYNVFTIGCYLTDTDMTNGPIAFIPGSHNGPLYDQYDGDGQWAGCLSGTDSAKIDMSNAEYVMGRAGSVSIHNCRTLHYSPSSTSSEPRPLLLNCFTSADAKPYTPHPQPSSNVYKVVRGKSALWADHDPRPCQIPPDWSGGYTSIFAAQSGEDAEAN